MSDLDVRIGHLQMIPLFAECSEDDLGRLAERMSDLRFEVGEQLMREGERAESFMIIVSGTTVVKRGAVELATLGAGDFVGEMALIFDTRRTASVIATSPVRVVLADRSSFNELLAEVPDMAERVSSSAAYRSAVAQYPAS